MSAANGRPAMTRSHTPLVALLGALCLTQLAACSAPDTSPPSGPETTATQTQGETPAPTARHILETGQPIVSLAAIPATQHLGKSTIIAAHGADGISIMDTDGTVLWIIDTPARLVAHYQGLLVVYAQDDDGTSTLERYRLNGPNPPTLIETASPSPIAATTLQRTAIASLGPAQISGSDLIIGDAIISVPEPITAIASAAYFPPLISGQTLLIATQTGDIIIEPINLSTE